MREFCAVPMPSSGLYKGTVCFTVGRGPVRRHASSRPRDVHRDREVSPTPTPVPRDESSRPALTVGRGPVPRHASIVTVNVRGLWAADVSRFGR